MASETKQGTLDDIETKYESEMGHKPQTVQQLLNFCRQNGINWKYKDINTWWKRKSEQKQTAKERPIYNTGMSVCSI